MKSSDSAEAPEVSEATDLPATAEAIEPAATVANVPAPEASATEPTATRPVEAWRDEKKTEPWLFAAARAYHRWAHGAELTEAEFDAALARAAGLSFH